MKKTIGNIFLANMKMRYFSVAMSLLAISYQAVGASPISSTFSFSDDMLTASQVAQNNEVVTVKGRVVDKLETMVGVAITVKGNFIMGTLSGIDGTFLLANVPRNGTLILSYLGYLSTEVDLSKLSDTEIQNINVKMAQSLEALEEVIVTGSVAQKKVSIVGAIKTIEPDMLISPSRSLSSQLVGRVAGITSVEQSGQPGKDGASFIIRGITALSGKTEPLILIDGLKRTLDDVDPQDIETFAILKDASATAVYGLEGANGIVVITTKKGKVASRPTVNVNYSTTLTNTTSRPDWVDAVDYAKLRNEAYLVRGKQQYYSDNAIALFGDDDMDIYPNIDWYDKLVKPNNFAQKGNFTISGGGSSVSYYLSGGFYKEDGMFRAAKDANAKFNQFNFRTNVTAQLSSTTSLTIGMDGRYSTLTEPGEGTGGILTSLNFINPTLFPHEYSNGTIPLETLGTTNPYAKLNHTGFKNDYTNIMSTNLQLGQDLKFITEGLKVNAIVSFTKHNSYSHTFVKDYQRHEIDYKNSVNGSGYDKNGVLQTINATPDIDDKMKFTVSSPSGTRTIEVQTNLHYSRSFFDKLHLTGLVLYKQREVLIDNPSGEGAAVLINALAAAEQSVAGRATIDWDHRYFLDVNAGFSGSQMFTEDKRWSSFPSIGLGWLVSEEAFWGESLKGVVNHFKLRATFGVVGAAGGATRFGYIGTTGAVSDHVFGYGQGAGNSETITGLGEAQLEQLGLTWERQTKINLGFEFGLFEKFNLVADFYKNSNEDQLIKMTSIPETVGLPSVPMINAGKAVSEGFDLDLSYGQHSFGDFSINRIYGIIGYTKNTIIEDGALDPKLPYHSGKNFDWGRQMVLISQGLFKDQNDIENSPVQSWGEVLPGDIKYKDVNNDGIVNQDDRVWLGNMHPKWTFSLGIDVSYKNFTFATFFTAESDQYRLLTGGRLPFNPFNAKGEFVGGESGAVFTTAMNDHWTPAWYSGDPATENPNAEYPRLGFGIDNQNNSQGSSFWLRNASYLRWQNIELGYTWRPKLKTSPFRSVYFYGRGDNIATFSKFKDWNPEQHDALAYPLKSTFTLGIEIGLNL